MKFDWQEWIKLQDQRIKLAQGNLVKVELRALKIRQIPRIFVAEISDLSRRLNLSYLILRILHPYVFPETTLSTPLNSREKALYALALARIGAYGESAELLNSIESQEKSILLLKASALVSQWNYRGAQKIYKLLLKKGDLNSYEVLIVKVNLASCLIHSGNYKVAIKILKDFDHIQSTYKLLYGNSLELLAQALLGIGNYEIAEETVVKAISILEEGESDYSLFAKKWLLIIRGFRKEIEPDNWNNLKFQGQLAGDFETCRDLDFYEACLKKNETQFLKVYFGTPFESYRRLAHKRMGESLKIPKSLMLNLGTKENPHTFLDLVAGEFLSETSVIHIPNSKLNILRALSRDLYRPLPIGELFMAVYPDQKFNVYSSPHRLFQKIQSTRQFLKKQKIPLEIELKKNAYFLKTMIFQMKVSFKYSQKFSSSFQIEVFRKWLIARGNKPFRRQDLELYLSLSKATTVKCLQMGLVKKWIRRTGGGNNFIYSTLPKIHRL